MPQQQLVCVTGAGGFIGSWVVKELLLRGYRVRGTTTRDPGEHALLASISNGNMRSLHSATELLHIYAAYGFEADRRVAHLAALQGAKDRLSMCRADLLDCGSLRAAFRGCHGVFHIASPLANDPVSTYSFQYYHGTGEVLAYLLNIRRCVICRNSWCSPWRRLET
jgi:cinnamoyl-CoA reductase